MRTGRTTGNRPGRGAGTGLVVLAVLAVLALGGCATTVAGTAWPAGRGPAPPAGAAGAPSRAGLPAPGTPAPVLAPAPAGPTTRTVPPAPVDAPRTRPEPGASGREGAGTAPAPVPARSPTPAHLTADVVADECLLDARALAGLLGAEPAVPATNAATERADGSRSRSCFAVGGSSTVSVNVYRTHRTGPVGYVRDAAGARTITGTGAGTAAALLDTVAGPTLQLGTARHLVTIAVAGRSPTDGQWRTAARAAAAALTGDR